MKNENRNLIKEIETNNISLAQAIKRTDQIAELIDLYIKRNPSNDHTELLEYFDILSIHSKVKLFKYNKKMIDDDSFQKLVIDNYINEENDFSNDIIKNTTQTEYLKKRLAFNFKNFENFTDEFDEYNYKNILFFYKIYKVKESDFILFLDGVNKRFNELDRSLVNRGIGVSEIFINSQKSTSANFKLNSENKKSNYEKESEINIEENEGNIFDPAFEKDITMKIKFKPYAFQECIDKITENKNIGDVLVSFEQLPILLKKTTLRMIKRYSEKTLETVLTYWEEKIKNLNEMKIKTLCCLLEVNFDEVSQYLMHQLFDTKSSINTKILIVEVLSCVLDSLNILDVLRLGNMFAKNLKKNKLLNDKMLHFFVKVFLYKISERCDFCREKVGVLIDILQEVVKYDIE